MVELGQDAQQLAQVRIVLAELGAQRVHTLAQDQGGPARIDRQVALPIAETQRAVLERQGELATLEDPPILVAEDRQQDLVGELCLHRLPVDVEEARVGR